MWNVSNRITKGGRREAKGSAGHSWILLAKIRQDTALLGVSRCSVSSTTTAVTNGSALTQWLCVLVALQWMAVKGHVRSDTNLAGSNVIFLEEFLTISFRMMWSKIVRESTILWLNPAETKVVSVLSVLRANC